MLFFSTVKPTQQKIIYNCDSGGHLCFRCGMKSWQYRSRVIAKNSQNQRYCPTRHCLRQQPEFPGLSTFGNV